MKGFLIISLFLAGHVSAYEKSPSMAPYVLISDSLDASLAEGTCMVSGYVRDEYGRNLHQAMVADTNQQIKVYSAESGFYEILLTDLTASFFCHHPYYKEIVARTITLKSQHRLVVNFNLGLMNGTKQVKKPVIYIYPPESMQVSIVLNHPGMTFMYPFYDSQWNVCADPNGDLTDLKTNLTHPYLFWEAETNNLDYTARGDSLEGFLVAQDTLLSFFENSLTALGLNSKEQADFITFWMPQMRTHDFVFIQYVIDENYSGQIAPIFTEPSADAIRRVFMLFTPVDKPDQMNHTIVPQELDGFERKGLTFVEWGGAHIFLPPIIP